MAIKITGKPEDVARYRKHLQLQGKHTKSVDPVYDDKPEGYRVLQGQLSYKWVKSVNGKPEEVSHKGNKVDPDAKLYIHGMANAKISDRMDEVLEPGGIDIRNYLKNKILLADHMYFTKASIGIVEDIQVTDAGVKFDAWVGDPQSAQLTEVQKDVRSLIAQGILRTVSVGFIPLEVRAPEYSDDGKLIKPAIIVRWELLELSVVAVPCNPDATFEMRQFVKRLISFNDNESGNTSNKRSLTEIKNILQTIKHKEVLREVQKLMFSKTSFSMSEAKAWADLNGFKSSSVGETGDTIELTQYDVKEFDGESLKTIELDIGVQAVTGTWKGGMMEKLLEELAALMKEQKTAIDGLKTAVDGSVKASETILASLAKSTEGDTKSADGDDADAFDAKKAINDIAKTVNDLSESVDAMGKDIWKAVEDIAKAITKED